LFVLLFLFCREAYSEAEVVTEGEKSGSFTAEAEEDDIGVTTPLNFPNLTRILESLGIVIIILVIMVYFLRRRFGIKTSLNRKKKLIAIVDTTSLGSKRHIHLVKIPGKLLLIGATNERIQSLAEITEKEIVDSVDAEGKAGDFMSFFKHVSPK